MAFDRLSGLYDPLDQWDVIYDVDGDQMGNPGAYLSDSAAQVVEDTAKAGATAAASAALVTTVTIAAWTGLAAGTLYVSYKAGIPQAIGKGLAKGVKLLEVL